jgi:uncharacterized protein (TIGR00725 family)
MNVPQPGSSGLATPYVAVIGPSEADADELDAAEQVGARLAQRGAIVVCGGHGGVMEAVCKGTSRHGGVSIGLLPGTDRGAGNPYLGIALPTGLGELRNGLVVRAADAVIAVGGSWGTLSEIALAVRTGKPVVTLGGWRLQRGDHGDHAAERTYRGGTPSGPVPADTPEEAVTLALALASTGGPIKATVRQEAERPGGPLPD